MIKKFLIGMSFLGICMGASFANTDEKKNMYWIWKMD